MLVSPFLTPEICSAIPFSALSPKIVGLDSNRKFPSLNLILFSTVFKALPTKASPSALFIVLVEQT